MVRARRLRVSLAALGTAGAIAVVSACSSSEDTAAASSGPNNEAVLADDAHGVAAEPLEMTDDTITFADTGDVAGLQMNHVLAPSTRVARPYLRRITGIDRRDGRVVFSTQNAALTDLFKEAHIHQRISWGDPGLSSPGSAPLDANPSPGDDGSLTGTRALPFDLDLGLHPRELQALPGGSATFNFGGKQVELGAGSDAYFDPSESYIQVGGGVEFDYDYRAWYDPRPTLVHLAVSGNFAAKLGAKMGASASVRTSAVDAEWPVHPHLGTLYFQAGLVPIFIDVNLAFSSKVDVALEGKVDVHASTTVRFGIRGGIHYENGRWSPISSLEASQVDEFSMNGDAKVTVMAQPIDTKLQFMLYGVIGPYIELDPYASISGSLFGGSLERKIGITGSAGGNIEVLGYRLGDVKFDLFDWSKTLESRQACVSGNYSADGGSAGQGRCKLEELKSCLTSSGSNCTQSACGSTTGYDHICDLGKVLQCRCEQQYGGSDAGASGGDCFERFCAPCTEGQTVCPTSF